MERIYFDNNATTMVDSRVVEEMLPYFSEKFGNSNSLHSFGREGRDALRRAYEELNRDLNIPEEGRVIFNSCATEGNNRVLMGAYYNNVLPGKKKRILVSAEEHESLLEAANFVGSLGADVQFIALDKSGRVTPETLLSAIGDDPSDIALISVMLANNETGIINPVADLAQLAHERGILFHTDAVQAIGKIPVDVTALGVDFLTSTAHKFHGPKGVGFLYIAGGCHLPPLLHGGEHMGGERSGTVNIPLIVGLVAALRYACSEMGDELGRVKEMRDSLEKTILEAVPGAMVFGSSSPRVPNTSLFSFPNVEGEAMLWDLNQHGVAASTGSACSSESLKESAVIDALKVGPDFAHTSIRISLSRFTTPDEIERGTQAIIESYMRLRKISFES